MKKPSSDHEALETGLNEIYDVHSFTRIYRLFILLALVGMVSGFFILLATNKILSAVVLAIGIVPVLASLYLVNVRKFESATTYLAVFLILMNTVLASMGLGVHNINTIAYPAILIIASLVIRKRTMIFLTLLTVISMAWLVFGELLGLYKPTVLVRSIPGDFLSASLIVVLTGMMTYRLTESLFKSFSRLQVEVTERKSVEESLRRREAIREAVTFAAEQFLKTSDWRLNINEVLECLGRKLHVTHVYLFEHFIDVEGVEFSLLKYEWTQTDYRSDFDNSRYQVPNPINMKEGSTDHDLRHGHIFIGNSSTFPPAEKERLNGLGVKAMMEVPLFVDGKWWGTFGMDDYEEEREWSSAEMDALNISAGLLSAVIQRQAAESAVRESERIYRQAIEAAGAVPYYQDYKVNKYVFMGQGIQKITGYSHEEMDPDLWENIVQDFEFIGDLKGAGLDTAIKMARTGKVDFWNCDYKILSRDGKLKWVADAAIELFDETGNSYGSIGILQDITDRKLIEARLRQRETMLEATTFAAEQFLKSPDWRTTIDSVLERLGKELNVSHAYLFERHKEPDGEILSSMINEWTAPGFKPDLDDDSYQNIVPSEVGFERYYETLDSGAPLVGSSSAFTENEREYWDSLGIKAILELRIVVNGQQWGVIGFDDMEKEREWTLSEVDVIKVAANVLGAAIERQLDGDALKNELTERRRAEQALRLSEEKFSKAFHTTQVLMTIEDDHHIFVDVNKAFEDAIGHGRDEIVGHNASELNIFYSPEDAALLRDALSMNDGNLKNYETPFRRKNGEIGFVLLSSEKIKLDNVEYTLTSGLDITERKRAEVALREGEARYRALFEQSHDAVFILNLNSQHIAANQRAAEMLGYTVNEIQGISLGDLSAELSESEQIMSRVLAGEHIPTFERLFRKKNGEVFPVEINAELVRDDMGNPLHVQSVVRDVSQRKIVEKQIQQQAARAAALASLSRTLTQTSQDYHLMMETVVRRCAELIGDGASIFSYSPENEFLELVAVYNQDSNAMDIFKDEIGRHPIKWNEGAYVKAIGDNQPVLIPFIPAEKMTETAPLERREYYKKLPLHSMMLAPLHVQGRTLGVIGMARHSAGRNYTPEDLTFLQDIADRSALAILNSQYYTELERELAERKRAEEKYRSIFDNSIDGIFQSTAEGRFLSVNAAMARIYGYDSPEDMLESVEDIATQLYVDAGQRKDVQERLASSGKIIGYETLDYRKDGSTFWASMSVQAIRDENGNLMYYEGAVEDITPRKRAEAEREALIQELANKNAELEQFTYTVSHDLKSPLVTINGFLGYLEQDAASGNTERLKKDTQRIHEAVQKMQRLLSELLELSRIGRMMNPPTAIPFGALVKDALDIVQGQLGERNVTVHVQPGLPLVYVDCPRLIEVVQNLVDNAAKYMGDQPKPQIEIGQRGNENGLPVFFIKDNGIGIDPQYHERVFGLFNKLDAKSEGTGVGLALVRRIIEVHGGRIWVESEAGKGATFLFTLPTGPGA